MEAFVKRIMESMIGLGQRKDKGDIKDCFIFGSYFFLKSSTDAAVYVGADFIGLVETITKGFCKYDIKKLTKDWSGGSYLVFSNKPMVTGDRPLLTIGYKYNSRKVLFFIKTEGEGRTKYYIPY